MRIRGQLKAQLQALRYLEARVKQLTEPEQVLELIRQEMALIYEDLECLETTRKEK